DEQDNRRRTAQRHRPLEARDERPGQQADDEEERLRQNRVLVVEVAVRPAARRHLVCVMRIEVRVAVGMAIEEAAAHERAGEQEERRTGQGGKASHCRTLATAPTPTAASAQASTSIAPTFRS